MFRISSLIFISLFLYNCTSPQPGSDCSRAEIDSLKKKFDEYRLQKDEAFKTEAWSPLTAEDKKIFKGLNYFPYDISWRYKVSMRIYEQQDSTTISGSREGDIRPALRYGYFEFTRDDKKQHLEVIKILPRNKDGQAHFFLGFWDETSGRESYAGGRYIDLEENPENEYVLDFNYAYNPYCAYSHRYSCAIPPLENRLTVAVKAGERNYKGH